MTFTDARILPQRDAYNFTHGKLARIFFTHVFLGMGRYGPVRDGPGRTGTLEDASICF